MSKQEGLPRSNNAQIFFCGRQGGLFIHVDERGKRWVANHRLDDATGNLVVDLTPANETVCCPQVQHRPTSATRLK